MESMEKKDEISSLKQIHINSICTNEFTCGLDETSVSQSISITYTKTEMRFDCAISVYWHINHKMVHVYSSVNSNIHRPSWFALVVG